AMFDLPLLAPVYPTAAGLVAAVSDWDAEPEPLVPMYLRRPDAKPQAAPR
ncbi:MAG: tRNA (adenosine(37)-N6)-threonylcarbamoyltransferase complex dimerization subunit type 1 TsaB, partial [Mycobacterium sp.]